jgi:hypothetical protein
MTLLLCIKFGILVKALKSKAKKKKLNKNKMLSLSSRSEMTPLNCDTERRGLMETPDLAAFTSRSARKATLNKVSKFGKRSISKIYTITTKRRRTFYNTKEGNNRRPAGVEEEVTKFKVENRLTYNVNDPDFMNEVKNEKLPVLRKSPRALIRQRKKRNLKK